MTQYKTAAVASISVMTLTTMFLYPLNAKGNQGRPFSEGDQLGTIFCILFWIVAFIAHHICQGEDISAQMLTIEFVALNIGVGLQMLFAARPGSMIDWMLNSSWLMYAVMGIVTLYSEDPPSSQPQLRPSETKSMILDLQGVEQRLERIQARLDRMKTATKKVD